MHSQMDSPKNTHAEQGGSTQYVYGQHNGAINQHTGVDCLPQHSNTSSLCFFSVLPRNMAFRVAGARCSNRSSTRSGEYIYSQRANPLI